MSSSECFANPPITSPSSGVGEVDHLAGLKTYITGPPHSTRAILLVSDVFGFEAPKLRKIADKVAAAGFLVVVPDFLYGDPYDPTNPHFARKAWSKAHPTDKGYEDSKQVIAALKDKGVSAVGAAGFCWGGVVVTKLARSDDFKAAVVLHPGQLTVDDINAVKVPISFLGAEIDLAAPPEQLKQFGDILTSKNEVVSFVKIYPSVSHGWTIRYNNEDESAVKSAAEAQSDTLEWLVEHVK